jgi:hypothetical protein
MYHQIPLISLLLFLAACRPDAASKDPAGPKPGTAKMDSTQLTTIEWLDSANRDFGKVMEGQKLEVSYRFKNAGGKPLVIERVQPSCGCTVAEQPREPVAPGAEGLIKASFNSEGHVGINHKSLYVYANAKGSPRTELHFEVEVEKKKF